MRGEVERRRIRIRTMMKGGERTWKRKRGKRKTQPRKGNGKGLGREERLGQSTKPEGLGFYKPIRG